MGPPPRTLAATQSERRRTPRYAFEAVLEIEWGSIVLQGRVCDISAGGLQVALADPLWVGASFAANLLLDAPLRLLCVVRRVEPGKGMGMTIEVPDEGDGGRLSALLEALAKK